MKPQQYGLSAIALAILVVGLAFAGVPAQTLLLGLVVLMCPLMMMSMMRGGHGHGSGGNTDESQDHSPSSGER